METAKKSSVEETDFLAEDDKFKTPDVEPDVRSGPPVLEAEVVLLKGVEGCIVVCSSWPSLAVLIEE